MKKAALLSLPVLAACVVVAVLFGSYRYEGVLVERFVDAKLGEYARLVEKNGQRYLIIGGRFIPTGPHSPHIAVRHTSRDLWSDHRFADEDFPVVILYRPAPHDGFQCTYRLSDGTTLWSADAE